MRARMLITVTFALLLAAAGCTTVTTKPGLGPGPNTPPGEKPFSMAKLTAVLKGQSGPKRPSAMAEDDPVTLSGKPARPKAELYTSMASLQERSSNLEEAQKLYEKALHIEPGNLAALVAYAHMQERRGETEAATQLYKRAVSKHPKNAAVHNDLGICYHRRLMLNDAQKMLQRAVDLQPDRALYRNNLATLLVDLDRRDEALKNLLAGNPPATAHYNLAFLLHRKGDDVAAMQHFREAANLDPTMQAANQWIAKLTPPTSQGDAPIQLASRQQPAAQVGPVVESSATPKVEKYAASGPLTQPSVDSKPKGSIPPLPPAETSAAPKMAATVSLAPPKVAAKSPAQPAENADVPRLPPAETSAAPKMAARVSLAPSQVAAKSPAVPAENANLPRLPAAEIRTAAKMAASASLAPSQVAVKSPAQPAAKPKPSVAPAATTSASSESRLAYRPNPPRSARDNQRSALTLPNAQEPISAAEPLPIAAHILRPQNVESTYGPPENQDIAAQPPRDRADVETVKTVSLKADAPAETTRIILR